MTRATRSGLRSGKSQSGPRKTEKRVATTPVKTRVRRSARGKNTGRELQAVGNDTSDIEEVTEDEEPRRQRGRQARRKKRNEARRRHTVESSGDEDNDIQEQHDEELDDFDRIDLSSSPGREEVEYDEDDEQDEDYQATPRPSKPNALSNDVLPSVSLVLGARGAAKPNPARLVPEVVLLARRPSTTSSNAGTAGNTDPPSDLTSPHPLSVAFASSPMASSTSTSTLSSLQQMARLVSTGGSRSSRVGPRSSPTATVFNAAQVTTPTGGRPFTIKSNLPGRITHPVEDSPLSAVSGPGNSFVPSTPQKTRVTRTVSGIVLDLEKDMGYSQDVIQYLRERQEPVDWIGAASKLPEDAAARQDYPQRAPSRDDPAATGLAYVTSPVWIALLDDRTGGTVVTWYGTLTPTRPFKESIYHPDLRVYNTIMMRWELIPDGYMAPHPGIPLPASYIARLHARFQAKIAEEDRLIVEPVGKQQNKRKRQEGHDSDAGGGVQDKPAQEENLGEMEAGPGKKQKRQAGKGKEKEKVAAHEAPALTMQTSGGTSSNAGDEDRPPIQVLEVRQRLKTGRWSQQEIEVARQCADMVKQAADSLGRSVPSLLTHSGLRFYPHRNLNTAQMFSKIAAIRPDAPKDSTYAAWCSEEYRKEKAKYDDDDAFRDYLHQELRRLNLEVDEVSVSESNVRTMHIMGNELVTIGKQLNAIGSESHYLAVTWSSDPSAAALSGAYTSHAGLEDYCREKKLAIRNAVNNFGTILKNAEIGGSKLEAISLEDLIGMIFEVSVDKGASSSGLKTNNKPPTQHSQAGETATSTSQSEEVPTAARPSPSPPATSDVAVSAPGVGSVGTAPVVRRAGVSVNYLDMARQFIKTPWLPANPWHKRDNQKKRDYLRGVTRDLILMQIAVNARNPNPRVVDAGKLVIDAKCRWVNYPSGSGVPGFTFANSASWFSSTAGIQEGDVSAIGNALVTACSSSGEPVMDGIPHLESWSPEECKLDINSQEFLLIDIVPGRYKVYQCERFMETWQGNPAFIPAAPAPAQAIEAPPRIPAATPRSNASLIPTALSSLNTVPQHETAAPTAAAAAVTNPVPVANVAHLPTRPARLDEANVEPSLSTLTKALHNLKATYAPPIPPVHPPQPPTPVGTRPKINFRKEKRVTNKFFKTYLADAPPQTATSQHNNIAATLVKELQSSQSRNSLLNSNATVSTAVSSTSAEVPGMEGRRHVQLGQGFGPQSRPGGPVRQPSQSSRRQDHPYEGSIPPRFGVDRSILPFWNMPPPMHHPVAYTGHYPNNFGPGYGHGMYIQNYGPKFGYGDSEVYGNEDAYGGDYGVDHGRSHM